MSENGLPHNTRQIAFKLLSAFAADIMGLPAERDRLLHDAACDVAENMEVAGRDSATSTESASGQQGGGDD
jgi:hypothetical protein